MSSRRALHHRQRSSQRLERNPPAMVRSAEPVPLTSTISKRRRTNSLAHSPSSPPPRSSASNLSTIASTERRRRSSSGSPSDAMMRDSPQEGRNSRGSSIEVTGAVAPAPPISPFPGFRPGNLVRMTMKNFLTFSDTAIYPGPRMNLILGPNGTGKSTVCNAMCIVFAGNPKLLGRSTDLGAFVKHGETEAEVEALVYEPKAKSGVRSVKRVFDTDGKSSYFLDGKKVKMSEIVSRINKRYDIQLDNLSQFMPQEKVAEFTQMKPDELLTITIRSLGGSEKEAQFVAISKMDQELAGEEQRLQQNEKKLAQLQAQHEAEEQEVRAYKQQQEAKEKLEVYKRYLPMAQAKDLKANYINVLAQRQEVETQLNDLKNTLRKANVGPVNRCEQELNAIQDSVKAARERCKAANDRSQQLMEASEDACMELTRKETELQDVEKVAERLKKGLQLAETKLARIEEELESRGGDDVKEAEQEQRLQQLREQRNAIRAEMTEISARKGPLEQQRQTAGRYIKHYNERLGRIGDIRQERIRNLSERHRIRYLSDCDRLVKEMTSQNAFRGKVCGPVAAEIEVENDYHARIMESCASGFLATAFVTESARDSRLLINESKRRFQGWAPDIISAPTTADDELDEYAIESQVPRRPVDAELQRLGIDCMVDDIYDSPKSVRAALNAQANLHLIHVGGERAEGFKEQLRTEQGVDCWFTPRSRCNVIRSRYDSSVRNLRVETQFANVTGATFSGSVQASQQEKARLANLIREQENKLSTAGNDIRNIDERIRDLSANQKNIDAEYHQVVERRRNRMALREKRDQAEQHVEHMRRKATDTDVQGQKRNIEDQLQALQEEAVKGIENAVNGLKSLRDTFTQFDSQTQKRAEIQIRLNAEKSKNAELEGQISQMEAHFQKAKEMARSAKEDYRRMLAKAERILSAVDQDKYSNIMQELQDQTAEWVEEQIAEQSGLIDGLATGQNTVERYELRQRKINKLTQEINHERKQHERKAENFRTEKTNFQDWLTQGMEKMRAKFSSLYRRLGCAGDLELINKDSERIGDLRLQILVSYRSNAELRPISSSANSGGEKMCCTMLFCFSLLQEEERMPPFVLVDELNQGLDPSNEMKIMTMMFEDAEKEIAPQSFVITPKILMNLPFHSNTKTHIVFNGTVSGKQDIVAPHIA